MVNINENQAIKDYIEFTRIKLGIWFDPELFSLTKFCHNQNGFSCTYNGYFISVGSIQYYNIINNLEIKPSNAKMLTKNIIRSIAK